VSHLRCSCQVRWPIDHPADRVDRQEAAPGFLVGEAGHAAHELVAGESQLGDEGMRHHAL
jgi:hypothetical protein